MAEFGAPMTPDQDFADLDWYDNNTLRPEKPFSQGLDSLPDGDYDFEFTSAELANTPKSGDRILRTKLRVNGSGEVERTWFLKSQENMNALLADLCLLGFPANKWGAAAGQPLKVALPAAVKALPGIRFRGRKSSRAKGADKPGEFWHDLHIGARIQGKPMPTQSVAAAASPNGNTAPPHNGPPTPPATDDPF